MMKAKLCFLVLAVFFASGAFAASKPPAIIIESVPTYGEGDLDNPNQPVSGSVVGASDAKHEILVYIHVPTGEPDRWWIKGNPFRTPIQSDLSWSCDIFDEYSGGADHLADQILAILMPKGKNRPLDLNGYIERPDLLINDALALTLIKRSDVAEYVINFSAVPAYGTDIALIKNILLKGWTSHTELRVVCYIKEFNGCWSIRPNASNPFGQIEASGKWAIPVIVSNEDRTASGLAAFLVPLGTTVSEYSCGGLPEIEEALAWTVCHRGSEFQEMSSMSIPFFEDL